MKLKLLIWGRPCCCAKVESNGMKAEAEGKLCPDEPVAMYKRHKNATTWSCRCLICRILRPRRGMVS